MEEISFNLSRKLKHDLKYELFKSLPKSIIENTVISLKNKNYFKFYLEYTNLYPKCENLSINFKNYVNLFNN